MTNDQNVEERLRRVEDIEEIRQLKARYCRLSDRGFVGGDDSPEQVAELFTEDGSWGDAVGREAIRELFRRFQYLRPFALHLAINPEIEIDGDRAHGRWWGMIPGEDETGATAVSAGIYEDEFARTPDGWRIRSLRFTPVYRSPFTRE